MLAWLTLLIGLSLSLLFGATSAAPAQGLSMEPQDNSTAHGLKAMGYTHSIQIGLDRESYRDYYWNLYTGPYGISVNPCGRMNNKPFQLAVMSGIYSYGRNDIDHPPNPPAMELSFEWNGKKDECKWKTNGGGDAGKLICGNYLTANCERDARWNDGAINCHGFSYHRGWACNW